MAGEDMTEHGGGDDAGSRHGGAAEELDVRVRRTPNPNSMLFHVNRELTGSKTGETFSSAEAASASPLAGEIFRVRGVRSVFFLPSSITVTRDPAVPWEEMLDELEGAIRTALDR